MKIFIDAGHGGSVDGVTANGIIEDTYTLQMSLHVARLLKGSDYRLEPVLSRKTDKRLTLAARAKAAKKHGCDFALSLHVNANGDPRVSGPMAFYMPGDLVGRGVAARYMHAVGREGFYIPGAGGAMRRPTKPSAATPENWPRVFNVLKPYKIPCCLLELGFATNQSDALWLQSPAGQRETAAAIFAGLVRAQALTEHGV